MISEIQFQFDQRTFSILRDTEKRIINAYNGTTQELSSKFKDMYAAHMHMDNLPVQLAMLPDVVTTANKDHQMGLVKVTSVNTVCQILQHLHVS